MKKLLALWLAAICISVPSFASDEIRVTDAYAYPPIGAGNIGVAFMTFENYGDHAYRLLSASSEQFGRIELHTHLMENGVMMMRKIDQIDLPAGQQVKLESGGLHLMLFEPQAPIKQGDMLKLQLTVNRWLDGEAGKVLEHIEILVPVKARGSKAAGHDSHDHHHEH